MFSVVLKWLCELVKQPVLWLTVLDNEHAVFHIIHLWSIIILFLNYNRSLFCFYIVENTSGRWYVPNPPPSVLVCIIVNWIKVCDQIETWVIISMFVASCYQAAICSVTLFSNVFWLCILCFMSISGFHSLQSLYEEEIIWTLKSRYHYWRIIVWTTFGKKQILKCVLKIYSETEPKHKQYKNVLNSKVTGPYKKNGIAA